MNDFALALFRFTKPIVLFLSVWLISHSNALSQSASLRYAISHYPPFVIEHKQADDSSFSGIDLEILTALAEKANLELELVPCPWARCLAMLKKGQVDITGSILKTTDRETFLNYLEPAYADAKQQFYFAKSKPILIKAFDDLYPYEVAIQTGARHFNQFDTNKKIRRKFVNEYEHAFNMLVKNRIDLVLGSDFEMDYIIRSNGWHHEIAKTPFHFSEGQYSFFAMSKKSSHVSQIPRLNILLQSLIEDGVIESIFKNYKLD